MQSRRTIPSSLFFCNRNTAVSRTKNGRGYGRWWLGLCLLVALVFAGKATYSSAVSCARQSQSAGVAATLYTTQNIEHIRVGQRVVAHNPDPGSSARTSQLTVDPATWRLLRLRAEDRWADGTLDVIDVETLQPPEWLSQHVTQVGATVPLPLDLLEMGVPESLQAKVVANEPCPAIAAGPGCVVLTTVNHLNPNLFELTFKDEQGRHQTVRPTGLHKFFSADRQSWTNTQDLREGERLRGISGWVTLTRSARVPGVHRVYNMTVSGEHVFHVSSLGLLSHNTNPCGVPNPNAMTGDQQALKELAHEASLDGRRQLSVEQAETILDWADQVQYPGWRAGTRDVGFPSNWAGRPGFPNEPHIHIELGGGVDHVPVPVGVRPR